MPNSIFFHHKFSKVQIIYRKSTRTKIESLSRVQPKNDKHGGSVPKILLKLYCKREGSVAGSTRFAGYINLSVRVIGAALK